MVCVVIKKHMVGLAQRNSKKLNKQNNKNKCMSQKLEGIVSFLTLLWGVRMRRCMLDRKFQKPNMQKLKDNFVNSWRDV